MDLNHFARRMRLQYRTQNSTMRLQYIFHGKIMRREKTGKKIGSNYQKKLQNEDPRFNKRFVRRQETGNPHKPLCQRSRETKSIRSSKSQYNNNDKLYYQNRKRKKARLSSSNNSSNIFLKRVSSAFAKTANSFELRQSVQKVDLKDFNVNVRTWLMSFRFVF